MTDKEKAIEYIFNTYYKLYDTGNEKEKKIICEEIKINDNQKIRIYLAGLAEGRKEAIEKNFKEAAYQKYVNNSLATFDMKKALEDARDQIRIVKENEELKAQIEKMKCCKNCKGDK